MLIEIPNEEICLKNLSCKMFSNTILLTRFQISQMRDFKYSHVLASPTVPSTYFHFGMRAQKSNSQSIIVQLERGNLIMLQNNIYLFLFLVKTHF